jgi:anti-sigma B factor antagonist
MGLTEFDFSVVVHRRDGWDGCIVAVTGEVDMNTAPAFEEKLLEAIQENERVVVIDLTATTFIDSTFLSSLVGAERQLRDRDGSLVVVCADPTLRKVFTITGLDRLYTIVETVDEATGTVGQPTDRASSAGEDQDGAGVTPL